MVQATIDKLPESEKAPIFDNAAKDIGGEFSKLYEGYKKDGKNAGDAFSRAKTRYLVGKSPLDKYLDEITTKLKNAWRGRK